MVKQSRIPKRKNFNSEENNDAINLNGERIIKFITNKIARKMRTMNNQPIDSIFFDLFMASLLFFQKKVSGTENSKLINRKISLKNCSVNSPTTTKKLIH